MDRHRQWAIWAGLGVLIMVSGCRETATQRLVGRWVAVSGASAPQVAAELPGTDLDQVDVRITLDFQPRGKIVMWRDEHLERLAGTWKVLDVVGNTVRIQIIVPPGEPASAGGEVVPTTSTTSTTSSEDATPEVRNFEIEFDKPPDDESPSKSGFTLTEEGADPQFGTLHFRRVDS